MYLTTCIHVRVHLLHCMQFTLDPDKHTDFPVWNRHPFDPTLSLRVEYVPTANKHVHIIVSTCTCSREQVYDMYHANVLYIVSLITCFRAACSLSELPID